MRMKSTWSVRPTCCTSRSEARVARSNRRCHSASGSGAVSARAASGPSSASGLALSAGERRRAVVKMSRQYRWKNSSQASGSEASRSLSSSVTWVGVFMRATAAAARSPERTPARDVPASVRSEYPLGSGKNPAGTDYRPLVHTMWWSVLGTISAPRGARSDDSPCPKEPAGLRETPPDSLARTKVMRTAFLPGKNRM